MADAQLEIDTTNYFAMHAGQNLPNHSTSRQGRGKFIRQGVQDVPTFRTRQEAYRYAAWLITLTEVALPDEEGCEAHTFEVVRDAVRNC